MAYHIQPNIQNTSQPSSRKPKNIKQHNQRLILSLLRGSDGISIAEISVKTNLSKTTVSKIISYLCEQGLVSAIGKGVSSDVGGKRPELFVLNADYTYVIAVNLFDVSAIECALLDMKGSIRRYYKYPLAADSSYVDCVRLISKCITNILQEENIQHDKLFGISLACEGIVDALSGTIIYSMHHDWNRMLPIQKDLLNCLDFDIPIFVENVCRYGGYAELLFPDNCKYQNLITIWSDSFVGGSILNNQQLVHGFGGLIGEFGHMVIEPSSQKPCSCGGHGCFESLVSKENVLHRAEELLKDENTSSLNEILKKRDLQIQDIFDASNEEDPLAQKILDEVVYYFSIFIHNLASTNNPGKVIIQGLYTDAGEYFLKELQKRVHTFPFYKIYNDIEIAYSSYSNKEIDHYFIKGAAKYMLDLFFNSYTIN